MSHTCPRCLGLGEVTRTKQGKPDRTRVCGLCVAKGLISSKEFLCDQDKQADKAETIEANAARAANLDTNGS